MLEHKQSFMINITFPDGNIRQFEAGVSAMDIAKSISMGLAQKVLVAKVDGDTWDSSRPINHDASLQLLTWDNEEAKKTFWHSSAHLMAEALEDIANGNEFEADVQKLGQLAGVVYAAGRRVGAGHSDANHVCGANRFGGDDGGEGGVNAAAEADNDIAESALPHVIAGAEDEGVEGAGLITFFFFDIQNLRA